MRPHPRLQFVVQLGQPERAVDPETVLTALPDQAVQVVLIAGAMAAPGEVVDVEQPPVAAEAAVSVGIAPIPAQVVVFDPDAGGASVGQTAEMTIQVGRALMAGKAGDEGGEFIFELFGN